MSGADDLERAIAQREDDLTLRNYPGERRSFARWIRIPGDTYHCRKLLYAAGCRFSKVQRAWYAPEPHVFQRAKAIVLQSAPEQQIANRTEELQLSRVPDGRLLQELERRGLKPGLPLLNEEVLPTIDEVAQELERFAEEVSPTGAFDFYAKGCGFGKVKPALPKPIDLDDHLLFDDADGVDDPW